MKKLLILLTLVVSQVQAQEFEILFTRQVDNNDNIYVVNQQGDLRRITNHPRKDSSPALSPDGKYIVFTSERIGWWKIWLMDEEQKTFSQLTNASSAEYSPSWSPDGSQIVFTSSRNGGSEIFTMNPKGENIKQLTNGNNNTMPSWASNGRIYYSSKVSGVYQIWSMVSNGSNKRQLTTGAGDKLMPQLSPDEKSLLYYGNQDGNMEIYRLGIDSSVSTRLTNDPLLDIRPRWSPDGKRIVFERGNKRNTQHIYLMDADGKNQRQLTKSGYNYAPSFAPKPI